MGLHRSRDSDAGWLLNLRRFLDAGLQEVKGEPSRCTLGYTDTARKEHVDYTESFWLPFATMDFYQVCKTRE